MQLEIFFNTIHLGGVELITARNKCSKQDERILNILIKHKKLTPFEVMDIYNSLYPVAPVTSIRRSLTVLTNRGLLKKCDEMKIERLGTKNHFWKLIENTQ